MSYLVKDYLTKDVITVTTESTITEASKVMAADKNVEGYAVVLENDQPIGMVTERDLVNKVLATELDPAKTKVSEVMSTPLITVDPDEDLLKASTLMREKNVRKLVVMKDGIIYGIVTAKDIAQQCGDYVDKSIREIVRWTAPLNI